MPTYLATPKSFCQNVSSKIKSDKEIDGKEV